MRERERGRTKCSASILSEFLIEQSVEIVSRRDPAKEQQDHLKDHIEVDLEIYYR